VRITTEALDPVLQTVRHEVDRPIGVFFCTPRCACLIEPAIGKTAALSEEKAQPIVLWIGEANRLTSEGG
jgi:hypothetical protein